MASGTAIVKAVPSGDTLLLLGNAKPGCTRPELQLTLAHIQAPRMGRGEDKLDEPFAFESREFLRRLVIGKLVKFKVDFRVDSINRSFGTVEFATQNLAKLILGEGLASLKPREKCNGITDELYEEFKLMETAAQNVKKGIWNEEPGAKEASIRHPPPSVSNAQLFKALAGKRIPAIVEYVQNGCTLRVWLKEERRSLMLLLAGIQTPRFVIPKKATVAPPEPPKAVVEAPATEEGEVKKTAADIARATNVERVAEPFAVDAKRFVEFYLLHRDVEVVFSTLDRFDNFVGTVLHPMGNISLELLKVGFAKIANWTIGSVGTEAAKSMRQLEKACKMSRKNIWKDAVIAESSSADSFEGTVVEISGADSLVVEVEGTDVDRRIYLSSTRAPWGGNSKRGDEPEPYHWEAKEALRQMVLGQAVKVSIDYKRSPAGGKEGPEREFATVMVLKKRAAAFNAAEMLIQKGFATAVRHRADEDPSIYYDCLLAAEEKAKKARLGLHSSKSAPIHRTTDLTSNTRKAHEFLPHLQRDSKLIKAIVQYVFTGARFKVYIPSENCEIFVCLAGIQCPLPMNGKSRSHAQASVYGDQARRFARNLAMQRTVEISVESMDKGGNILGPVYVQYRGASRSLSELLLEAGLAKTLYSSASRTAGADTLFRLEKAAQEGKIGLWRDESPTVAVSKTKEAPVVEVVPAVVSEILSPGEFYIHAVKDLENLAKVEQMMREFDGELVVMNPKKGLLCAAEVVVDGGSVWRRAKIVSMSAGASGERQCKLLCIDYGNVVKLPVSKLRTVDASLFTIYPIARECVMAFGTFPTPTDEYFSDAMRLFSNMVKNKTVIARIHSRDSQNRLSVSIFAPTDEAETDATSASEIEAVSFVLIREGVSVVGRREQKRIRLSLTDEKDVALFQSILEAQELARKDRLNLWRFGDILSDEEDW